MSPVTNEELASMIADHSAAVNARLVAIEQGTDRRFAAIEGAMEKMAGIQDSADTLVMVAQTWKLADLGGRVVKWMATLLAGLAAIYLFVRDGPQ